jgi:hypothetical protein
MKLTQDELKKVRGEVKEIESKTNKTLRLCLEETEKISKILEKIETDNKKIVQLRVNRRLDPELGVELIDTVDFIYN